MESVESEGMLVTFEAKTFSDIAKIALKRNISRRFLSVLHQTVSREGYLHQKVSG